MGRGRQKAKQTKVARRLKYTTPETDLEALQRELREKAEREDDPYAKWANYDPDADDEAEDDEPEDDDEDWEVPPAVD